MSTGIRVVLQYKHILQWLKPSHPVVKFSKFHTQTCNFKKIFHEKESLFAYRMIESNNYVKPFPQITKTESNIDNLTAVLKRDWSLCSASELLDIFQSLGLYANLNNISITRPEFDLIIDSLTDKIHELEDDQIIALITALKAWPESPSVRSRNFIEIWAAIDDTLLKRYKEWSFDKMLQFVGYTYWLSIARACEFPEKAIQKIVSRAHTLTKSQIVQAYFYIGILRKAPFDIHNLEIEVRKQFDSFNIEDLTIVSMGMFKSKTPMRSKDLKYSLIEKIIEEASKIDEISMAALLKLIRYSLQHPQDDIIERLLNALEKEIPRVSLMCCVHIALLGTVSMTFHRACLQKVADKCLENIESARVKDLERLVLSFCLFNFMPNKKFLDVVCEELRKPNRSDEINQYFRPFACCISYMTMFEYFPYDLMDKVLCEDSLLKAYDTPYMYGREILMLDCTIEVECKDYSGSRLNRKTVKTLSRKYTDYVPDENFKKEYNIAEKIVLNIIKVLRKNRGGEKYVRGDHILPHYQRGDIILCDDNNGNAVDISDHIPTTPFGAIKKVPDDKNWFALIVAGQNAYIRNSDDVTGHFVAKKRHLRKLGYLPAFINYKIWNTLVTDEQKYDYLTELIDKAKQENSR